MMPGGKGDAGAGRLGEVVRVPVGELDDVGAAAAATAGWSVFVFGGELFVADEAVGLEIGDADFQGVVAGVDGIGDVGAEGEFPEDAEVFAVDDDLSEHLDAAEVEEKTPSVGRRVGREGEFIGVAGGAGKIFDALVGMV